MPHTQRNGYIWQGTLEVIDKRHGYAANRVVETASIEEEI